MGLDRLGVSRIDRLCMPYFVSVVILYAGTS